MRDHREKDGEIDEWQEAYNKVRQFVADYMLTITPQENKTAEENAKREYAYNVLENVLDEIDNIRKEAE